MMLMLRTRTLLLVPALALAFAACGGGSGPASSTVGPPGPTTPADMTPPSTPTGLTAVAAGSSVINLSWNASTDNVGVTGYVVRRNGIQVATPVTASYTNTGLSAGTAYSFSVAARDAAGNSSLYSASASSTTAGTPPPGGIPSTLGWFQIPSTKLRSVCADGVFPEVRGNTGCASVTLAWSGGVMDTARNRLVMWGGGHTDYAGNEVYALDLNTLTLSRLNDPSTPVRDGCTNGGIYADGRPSSRHSYNHVAYLPNQDAMFAWGGSQWQCGNDGADAWLFNFPDLSWTKKSSTNGPRGGIFASPVSYDQNTDLVYVFDWSDLRSFNPSTNTWSRRSSASISGGAAAAVIDPVRKKYFFGVAGLGTSLHWYDVSSATALVAHQSQPTVGCAGFLGSERVGMEYDPVQDRIVGWNGGDTVYILNPDTLSCATVSYPGGPSAIPQGTYGRFRYSPSLNVFVVCNGVDDNCYTLRLTP